MEKLQIENENIFKRRHPTYAGIFLTKQSPEGQTSLFSFSQLSKCVLRFLFAEETCFYSFSEKPGAVMSQCRDHKQIKHLSRSVWNEPLTYNPEIDSGYSWDYWSCQNIVTWHALRYKCITVVRTFNPSVWSRRFNKTSPALYLNSPCFSEVFSKVTSVPLWNKVITAKQWVAAARKLSHPITALATL